MQPVTAGLLTFQGQHSTNYTLLSAAVLISIVPILAVYFIFPKILCVGDGRSGEGLESGAEVRKQASDRIGTDWI
ncbi:hypothetical protein HMSSN036_76490 [Paenibacillus macerans]|nr:hypothetical protein HMSSN036_76490 [Paenibacillus macerans]